MTRFSRLDRKSISGPGERDRFRVDGSAKIELAIRAVELCNADCSSTSLCDADSSESSAIASGRNCACTAPATATATAMPALTSTSSSSAAGAVELWLSARSSSREECVLYTRRETPASATRALSELLSDALRVGLNKLQGRVKIADIRCGSIMFHVQVLKPAATSADRDGESVPAALPGSLILEAIRNLTRSGRLVMPGLSDRPVRVSSFSDPEGQPPASADADAGAGDAERALGLWRGESDAGFDPDGEDDPSPYDELDEQPAPVPAAADGDGGGSATGAGAGSAGATAAAAGVAIAIAALAIGACLALYCRRRRRARARALRGAGPAIAADEASAPLCSPHPSSSSASLLEATAGPGAGHGSRSRSRSSPSDDVDVDESPANVLIDLSALTGQNLVVPPDRSRRRRSGSTGDAAGRDRSPSPGSSAAAVLQLLADDGDAGGDLTLAERAALAPLKPVPEPLLRSVREPLALLGEGAFGRVYAISLPESSATWLRSDTGPAAAGSIATHSDPEGADRDRDAPAAGARASPRFIKRAVKEVSLNDPQASAAGAAPLETLSLQNCRLHTK
eukprot:tig00000113_g5634.t1